jgi:hypothetical protein
MATFTITTRFERVPLTVKKSVPCTVCGKKVRRQRTFEQTRNPWNRNAAGQPKSYADIYRELDAKGAAWKAEPETHAGCEPEGGE